MSPFSSVYCEEIKEEMEKRRGLGLISTFLLILMVISPPFFHTSPTSKPLSLRNTHFLFSQTLVTNIFIALVFEGGRKMAEGQYKTRQAEMVK